LRPLCPHLHFEDGFGPDEAGGAQLARRVWLRRIALTGGHTRIVVPSQMLREIARERWGFSIRRVLHLANGVDLQRFAAPQKTAPLPVPAGAPVIGSVGALRPEKNFARLLRAVAAIGPDHRPHLVLVGEGPERGALERLAGQLGIADRTHLIGRVERPETVLGAFTIYALSSDTEQMPISLLEAMAAGLPAVATNVGDVRDMLAPPNRPMVVQSADEQGFAKALSGLLGDGALRAEIGQANRERACEHFGEDHMVESYRCLFEGRAANSEQGRR
jgi:glycosyltransferase involved in cell wall biosynthesis